MHILISNQNNFMHKHSKCITYKICMGEMFDLHTLEPCRRTLEQGFKPTTAYIGPCDGSRAGRCLRPVCSLPMTLKGIKRLGRRDERQTHIRRHVLWQETLLEVRKDLCAAISSPFTSSEEMC